MCLFVLVSFEKTVFVIDFESAERRMRLAG
jgi:predicted Ser/Thr protein kinase